MARLSTRAAVIVAAFFLTGLGTTTWPAERDVEEARRIWEKALVAKGGREAIGHVRSIARSSQSKWGGLGFKRHTGILEQLYVLPSKLWDWHDVRPAKVGVSLQIVDLDRDWFQMVWGDGIPLAPGKPKVRDVQKLREAQASLLLETPWQKPVLRGIRHASVGFHSVYVVETIIGDQVYEFFLDKKSFLAHKIIITTTTEFGPATREIRMSDYRGVAGILLPHRVTRFSEHDLRKYPENVQYQINVEYDERVFQSPPTLDNGPQGWRRREK